MKIGPTFYDELRAVGATTEIAWSPESGHIEYAPSVTPAQRAAVEAVLAAHDPVASQAAHEKQQANEAAKAKLRDIDIASVRALREYIAAKADAPVELKTHEAAAVAERAKLK